MGLALQEAPEGSVARDWCLEAFVLLWSKVRAYLWVWVRGECACPSTRHPPHTTVTPNPLRPTTQNQDDAVYRLAEEEVQRRVRQLQQALHGHVQPPVPSTHGGDNDSGSSSSEAPLILPVEQLPPPARMAQVEGFLRAVCGGCGHFRPWPVGLPVLAGAEAGEGEGEGAVEGQEEEEAGTPAIEV